MEDQFGQEDLIRKIAKKAGFTLSDVRIIYYALQESIYDIVKEKHEILKNSSDEDIEVMNVIGLFNIRIKKIAPHEGYDALRRKRAFFGESYKVVLRPSRKFVSLMKENDEEEIV